MAKIQLNPSTGRPYGVGSQTPGKYRAQITTDQGTVSGPTVDNMLTAKRHAEVIRALLKTGASAQQARDAVKGLLA